MVAKANENLKICGFEKIAKAHLGLFDGPVLPVPLHESTADFLIVNGTINLSPRKKCALANAAKVSIVVACTV